MYNTTYNIYFFLLLYASSLNVQTLYHTSLYIYSFLQFQIKVTHGITFLHIVAAKYTLHAARPTQCCHGPTVCYANSGTK